MYTLNLGENIMSASNTHFIRINLTSASGGLESRGAEGCCLDRSEWEDSLPSSLREVSAEV